MKIIISAQQQTMDGAAEPRFGRCPWLIEVDSETNQWQALANPGASLSGGAGVAAAQCVIDQQAGAVISGAFGPHAANAFNVANVAMYLLNSDSSTVQQALDQFKQGALASFV